MRLDGDVGSAQFCMNTNRASERGIVQSSKSAISKLDG